MADRTEVRINRGPGNGPADGTAVLAVLAGAYERGWQPADLVHVTRRSLGAAEVRLAVWAIRYDARLSRAAPRAPRPWSDQLAEIAELPGIDRVENAGPLHRTALTALWRHLPRLPAECPPPSRWPLSRSDYPAVGATMEPAALGRVRGLLGKAERTEHPEEAETFTAHAQELMSKYSASVAVTHARRVGPGRIDVRCRRIHLDNPYLKEKAQLLSEIGRSNGVRTVLFSKLGMATTIGTPLGLDHVELLFGSLLVQAHQAMQGASRHRPSPASTAFRRAFLYGFAIRIGERLQLHRKTAEKEAIGMAGATYDDWKERLEVALDAKFAELFCLAKGRESWWVNDKRDAVVELASAG